ncbi:MAG: hypothetical protein ACKOEM_07500 [Planctomycetia bacterium]
MPLFVAVENGCEAPAVSKVAPESTSSELAAASEPSPPNRSVHACTRVWPV